MLFRSLNRIFAIEKLINKHYMKKLFLSILLLALPLLASAYDESPDSSMLFFDGGNNIDANAI